MPSKQVLLYPTEKKKERNFMKKVIALLLTAVFLCTMMTTVALAASSVSSPEYNVSGSKTFGLTADFTPKYITVVISDCTGPVSGLLTIDKPDGTTYQNFITYSGNNTFRKRVYNAPAGTYTFHFSNSGTATVQVTISN